MSGSGAMQVSRPYSTSVLIILRTVKQIAVREGPAMHQKQLMDVICRNQADGPEFLVESRNIRTASRSVEEDQSGTVEKAV